MPVKHLVTLLVSLSMAAALLAGDDDANKLLNQAAEKYRGNDYYAAAKLSLDAEHMADSTELKAKAVKYAIASYRKANVLYSEYTNIDKLLTSYSTYGDYPSLVSRMYAIGDAYYSGHRDPAYHALRWVPWLYDDDRTVEIYERAIELAPYSGEAAAAKLRTAIHLIETSSGPKQRAELDRAIELLRQLAADHPGSEEAKHGLLRLGVVLSSRAQYGDGDGVFNREAITVLNDFKRLYPNATEIDFVNKLILQTRDIQAKRMLNTADFYSDNERPEVAERYLGEIIRLYPDSTSADEAERKLTDMDATYIPQPMQPALEPRIQSYEAHPIPAYRGKLLVAPQNSNGKYLLPIYDLGISKKQEPIAGDNKENEEIEDAI